MREIEDLRAEGLRKLRTPFPPEAIGKMPRGGKGDKRACSVCHGWHAPGAIHLDYVGHANVTDRLLEVDLGWKWEPVAHDPDGQPALDRNSQGQPIGLWIKLTVCGITRLGYGSCDPGKPEIVKELIGDAIRNAAMRFGVALDLWAKEDLASQVRNEAGSAQAEPQEASREASSPPQNSESPARSPQPSTKPGAVVDDSVKSVGGGEQAVEESRVWGSAQDPETSPAASSDSSILAKAILDSADAGVVSVGRIQSVGNALALKADALPKGGIVITPENENLSELPESVLREIAAKLNISQEAMAV